MLPTIFLVLSILVASVGPGLRAQFSGESLIVRVFFDDLPTGRQIAAGLEPIESKYEKGYLVVEVTAEQLQRLQRRGLRTEPVSAQELATILAPPRASRSDRPPEQAQATAATGIPGFSCYRTVEETFAAAESIVTNNPTLASWVDVGDSWLKTDRQPDQETGIQPGYDMSVLVLTNANVSGPKPKMFVTSSIHGREYTPAELMTRFAESLISNYGVTADATWLLDHHEVHLMLQANPDGRKHAEGGQLWRKNVNENYCGATSDSRGADLNRNFDFMWDCCGGSSDSECSNTYHGASAASEPEVQAIQNYVRSIFTDQRGPNLTEAAPDDATGIFLDIHSSGQLILYPWGFTATPAPNGPQLRTFARKLGFFNLHTPQRLTDLYLTEGTAEDFGYGVMGLATLTYELGTEFFEDCSYFENTLLPRNMLSLYYAAKVARTPYMTPSGPEVVDGSFSLSAGEWPAVVAAGTSVTLSATLSDSQFNNANGTEPTQSVEAAEYYIDTPPWVTTPVPVPLPMVDQDGDVYEAALDTTGLSAGRHILFVRGKDSGQNWGAFSAIFLGIKNESVIFPTVTIAPKDNRTSVTEGTAVQFTLTRDPPAAAEMTVKVNVTERGEVIETVGSYQPPDEVTFTAGDTTATLTVLTEDDEQQESDGAVIATLQPGTDYRLGQASTQTAQVAVEDNEGDGPPGPIGPGLPPVPNPVPSAPRNLEAVGGDEQVTLSWEAPEDDGGFAITDYEYLISGTGGGWISTGSTETSHTVTELTNGRVYLFQVRAVSGAGAGNSSNRVEVTPGVGRLEFAHFANGSSITSDLVLVNVFARPIRPSLYFYDREGERIAAESVVELTEELEIAEDGSLTVQTEMQPLQALTISTHGQGEVVAGSVTVLSNGPLGGVLRFDLPGVGVAGVGAGQPLRDALFPARRQAGGISTAVAIRNLQEEELVMTCQLMQEGAVLEEVDIELQAKGQDGRFIEEVFTTTDTTDFVGMVRCTAPAGKLFAGVAVELDAGNGIFTTLPVLPVDRTVFRGGEYALDFAHFANGASITSDLVLVNVSIRPSRPAGPFTTPIPPTRPSFYFYDREGERLAAQSVLEVTGELELAEDGSLAVQTEMQPLEAVTISTHGQGEVVAGSVRVVAEGPIGGVLRFDLPGVGVAGVGTGQPTTDALFPARRQAGGISTAAAIRNLEAEELVVSCQLMKEGTVLEEVDIELEVNGQDGRFIEEVFTRTDTSDFVGLVRCTAEGEFTGVAVELDAGAGIFTTLPVVPVPAMTSQE